MLRGRVLLSSNLRYYTLHYGTGLQQFPLRGPDKGVTYKVNLRSFRFHRDYFKHVKFVTVCRRILLDLGLHPNISVVFTTFQPYPSEKDCETGGRKKKNDVKLTQKFPSRPCSLTHIWNSFHLILPTSNVLQKTVPTVVKLSKSPAKEIKNGATGAKQEGRRESRKGALAYAWTSELKICIRNR